MVIIKILLLCIFTQYHQPDNKNKNALTPLVLIDLPHPQAHSQLFNVMHTLKSLPLFTVQH